VSLQHIAVIDLGSNTARVVVMSADPGQAYRLEDEIREAERNARSLMESAFGRSVLFESTAVPDTG